MILRTSTFSPRCIDCYFRSTSGVPLNIKIEKSYTKGNKVVLNQHRTHINDTEVHISFGTRSKKMEIIFDIATLSKITNRFDISAFAQLSISIFQGDASSYMSIDGAYMPRSEVEINHAEELFELQEQVIESDKKHSYYKLKIKECILEQLK